MPHYLRLDVPASSIDPVGSGSYLRLGAYVTTPDESLIDDLGINDTDGIAVEQNEVAVTALTEEQVETNGKTSQTNKKELYDLTPTTHTPSTNGILLKTDQSMYVMVADSVVREVGYESTNVTTGDHRITVPNGIHYVDAANGVKIISDEGNVDIVAKGYVNTTSEGDTTDWTYGNKTSRTKGNTITYINGLKEDWIDGTKFQEVKGDETSKTFGSKTSWLHGCENNYKMGGKAEFNLSASITLNITISVAIQLFMKLDVGDIYGKIMMLDFKIGITKFDLVQYKGDFGLWSAKSVPLDNKSDLLKQSAGALILRGAITGIRTLAAKVNSDGAQVNT
jgi:hypothetical protein